MQIWILLNLTLLCHCKPGSNRESSVSLFGRFLSVMRHHSRGSLYPLLFPYLKSPWLTSKASNLSQTLKLPTRVCSYAGTLFSEKCNTIVRWDALYLTHRSWYKAPSHVDSNHNSKFFYQTEDMNLIPSATIAAVLSTRAVSIFIWNFN